MTRRPNYRWRPLARLLGVSTLLGLLVVGSVALMAGLFLVPGPTIMLLAVCPLLGGLCLTAMRAAHLWSTRRAAAGGVRDVERWLQRQPGRAEEP